MKNKTEFVERAFKLTTKFTKDPDFLFEPIVAGLASATWELLEEKFGPGFGEMGSERFVEDKGPFLRPEKAPEFKPMEFKKVKVQPLTIQGGPEACCHYLI